MWESRRDFQGVWEGWEAGLMAFHAFHTLSFPWSAFRPQFWINRCATQRYAPHPPRNACRYRLSMSALAIYQSSSIGATRTERSVKVPSFRYQPSTSGCHFC